MLEGVGVFDGVLVTDADGARVGTAVALGDATSPSPSSFPHAASTMAIAANTAMYRLAALEIAIANTTFWNENQNCSHLL